MRYRAVVQDGRIIVETGGAIPDGTAVRVVVDGEAAEGTKVKGVGKGVARSPKKRAASPDASVPGFGMWRDREELGKASEALGRYRRDLRVRATVNV